MADKFISSHRNKIASMWSLLPEEIKRHILNKLPKEDRFKTRLVCKSWHNYFTQRKLALNFSFVHDRTDDALVEDAITRLSNVQEVYLYNCYLITDKSLQTLAEKGPHVHTLNLCNCNQITSSGIQHLSALKELKTLDLGMFHNINPEFIENLVNNCPNLTNLNLSGTNVDDECLKLISKLPLKFLDLRRCQYFTDEGIKCIAKASLEALYVPMTNITDKTLIALSEGCPNLREFDFTCTEWTSNAFEKLHAKCQKLEKVLASGCLSSKI